MQIRYPRYVFLINILFFQYAWSVDVHKEYTFWNATDRDIDIQIVRLFAKDIIVTIPAFAPRMRVHADGIACLPPGVQFRVKANAGKGWQDITNQYQLGSYHNNCANQEWIISVNDNRRYVFMKYADYPNHYVLYAQFTLVNALVYNDIQTVRTFYAIAYGFIQDWVGFINGAPGKLNAEVKRALVSRFFAIIGQK